MRQSGLEPAERATKSRVPPLSPRASTCRRRCGVRGEEPFAVIPLKIKATSDSPRGPAFSSASAGPSQPPRRARHPRFRPRPCAHRSDDRGCYPVQTSGNGTSNRCFAVGASRGSTTQWRHPSNGYVWRPAESGPALHERVRHTLECVGSPGGLRNNSPSKHLWQTHSISAPTRDNSS